MNLEDFLPSARRALERNIVQLQAEWMRLIVIERKATEVLRQLTSRDNLIERFSRETYHALEEVGALFHRSNGHTFPAPAAECVRRLEETDLSWRLAEAQRERALVEERLRGTLAAAGFIIDIKQVEMVG